MPKTLSLDDIQLPPEDANKLAEINTDPNVGDEGVSATDTPAQEQKPVEGAPKEEEKKEEAEGGEKKDETEGGEKKEEAPEINLESIAKTPIEELSDEQKKFIKDNADTLTDEQKETYKAVLEEKTDAGEKKDDLTPFHEHPDWKKMVTEREEDKKTIDTLKTQVETLMKVKGVDSEQKEVLVTNAKERIKKDLTEGWKPVDQLELIERYGDYLKEELAQQKQAEEKEASDKETKRTEAVKEAETQINEFWGTQKVETEEDKNKVLGLVLSWKEDGTIPTPTIGTLKLAYDVLKARGELGKAAPVQPKKVEGQDDEQKKEIEEKKDTLGKSSKPQSTGDKGDKKEGKSYDEFHKKSLDDVVADAAKALG